MRITVFSLLLLLCCASASAPWIPPAAQADRYEVINPRAVEGEGVYYNELNLLVDGNFAEEGGARDGRSCVFWDDAETTFVLDLGAEFMLTGFRIQVDDNDDYRIEYSLDGIEYFPLMTFLEEYGDSGQGMATMSTVLGEDYVVDTPEFEPMRARYLRIAASRGDGRFAAAEVQALGYQAEAETADLGEGTVLIPSTGVIGEGEFMHAAGLIIDGRIPPEGGGPRSHDCVYWEDPEVVFTIDLGRAHEIVGLLVQLDGDDDYAVEYSLDGENFIHLLEVRADMGEIAEGMDTLAALPGHRDSISELEFWPVDARFVRLLAVAGSGVFSVSELQVYRVKDE